jgi:hypothetical protein
MAFCRWKNEGRKPDENSSLRRLEFMPKNLNPKFHLSISNIFFGNTETLSFHIYFIGV